MIRLIVISIIVGLITLFTVENMHHVTLNTLFTGPVEERLIFLLLGAFALGLLTMVFLNMIWKFRKKRTTKE